MAFSLRQWIERSMAIALQGADPDTSTLLDIEDIAEALCHDVMIGVCEEAGADPTLTPLVTETLTIALVNGVGAMPTKALTRFLPAAVVSDPADAAMSKKMRYLTWRDFIRPSISAYGYFSMRNQTEFNMTQPGTAYTPGAGMTGNIDLTIPCAPDMPATDTATITVPRKIEQLLVGRLAQALHGPVRAREAVQ